MLSLFTKSSRNYYPQMKKVVNYFKALKEIKQYFKISLVDKTDFQLNSPAKNVSRAI